MLRRQGKAGPRSIHVTCGDSAAGSFINGLAISPDDVVSLRDSLSCGPLGTFRDLESWTAMRLAYWESYADASAERANRKRRRRRIEEREGLDLIHRPERLANADRVQLWLGTGLDDQLMLAWIPQLLCALGIRGERLCVVQFERTQRGAAALGLGLLSPEEYHTHPAPRAIGQAELAYLDDAWGAVTAPDPGALLRFLREAPSPLPLLPAALRRLLRRYPDAHSGVNWYEALLLASTHAHGPSVARVIGHTLKVAFVGGDCIGDLWLYQRLRRLADTALPYPAVTMRGRGSGFGHREAHLTPVGERVAAGESNFIALNGIEDWVGGVRLDSRVGGVWYNRDDTLVHG